jgi:tetratricopeptide (TPR) repeat protein
MAKGKNRRKTGPGESHEQSLRIVKKIAFAVIVAALYSLLAPASRSWAQAPDRALQEALQRDLNRAADHLYKQAMRYMKKEEYWKATRELIIILDFHPQYPKLDAVVFELGRALYEMDMLSASERMFIYAADKYRRSGYLGDVLLGLQKVYYQKGDYAKSLRFYAALLKGFRHRDDLISEAHYYGGQAYYYSRNYDIAVHAFQYVKPRSEFYPYALYSLGLTHLKKKRLMRPWKA